jgi:hypothetical protein
LIFKDDATASTVQRDRYGTVMFRCVRPAAQEERKTWTEHLQEWNHMHDNSSTSAHFHVHGSASSLIVVVVIGFLLAIVLRVVLLLLILLSSRMRCQPTRNRRHRSAYSPASDYGGVRSSWEGLPGVVDWYCAVGDWADGAGCCDAAAWGGDLAVAARENG